jgi:hypothetical protein
MRRWTLLLAALSVLFSGCSSSSQQESSDCDLDVENLKGDWVSLKGGGSGQDTADKYARLRFIEEDGKKKAIYTAGQLVPNKPMTNKYTYEYQSKTSQGDVLYSLNMFPDKSKQRIERLKKDNRSLGLKFEGRIYIKVDPKRCALVLSDMYVTYVRGEETIDSNPAGTRTYLRVNPADPPLSFAHCNESGQLIAFANETVDWAKDTPLDPRGGIYKNEPVWFHFGEKNFEGSEDEVKQKLTEIGFYAEEGATYELEMWEHDLPWGGSKTPVVKTLEPNEEGIVPWKWQGAFDSAPQNGIFAEMHRYKIKDGKRTLLGAACNYYEPEQERTAEEKAEAEAEAGKK